MALPSANAADVWAYTFEDGYQWYVDTDTIQYIYGKGLFTDVKESVHRRRGYEIIKFSFAYQDDDWWCTTSRNKDGKMVRVADSPQMRAVLEMLLPYTENTADDSVTESSAAEDSTAESSVTEDSTAS